MRLESIKGLNMELTEAIKARITDKMAAVEKLTAEFGSAAVAHVEVGKTSNHHNKGPIFRAEINVDVPGTLLRAEAEQEDLYQAIDVAVADLKRQLVERKERLQERHHGQRPDKA